MIRSFISVPESNSTGSFVERKQFCLPKQAKKIADPGFVDINLLIVPMSMELWIPQVWSFFIG